MRAQRWAATAIALVAAFGGCRGDAPADSQGGATGDEASARSPAVPAQARGVRAGSERASGFREAGGTREWRWPRDHGAHPEYATEWWYTTGVVRTASGRRFGFELTFFRRGLVPPQASPIVVAAATDEGSSWRARDLILAHAAVTDVAGRRFAARQELERAARGWAGADTSGLNVWAGTWRLAADPDAEGDAFRLRVPPSSTNDAFGLDLRLSTTRPPVLHGDGGLSRKDARPVPHASWYVSLPRLETSGTLTIGGETFEVTGLTWLDHEFFSGGLAPDQVGWDWFSARLADGRDLMLFRLRDARGGTRFTAGTVTSPDGRSSRAVDARGATFEPLEHWRSPATGARYPVRWRASLPAERLEITTRTPLVEQELGGTDAAGFVYWEGLADYSGTWRGERITGEGYVEMTGYDAPIELR